MEIKYDIDDLKEMQLLWQHYGGLTGQQQDFIHNMLKKYISPNRPRPIAGCGSCPLGWGNAFIELREWASKNSDKFNEVETRDEVIVKDNRKKR